MSGTPGWMSQSIAFTGFLRVEDCTGRAGGLSNLALGVGPTADAERTQPTHHDQPQKKEVFGHPCLLRLSRLGYFFSRLCHFQGEGLNENLTAAQFLIPSAPPAADFRRQSIATSSSACFAVFSPSST